VLRATMDISARAAVIFPYVARRQIASTTIGRLDDRRWRGRHGSLPSEGFRALFDELAPSGKDVAPRVIGNKSAMGLGLPRVE